MAVIGIDLGTTYSAVAQCVDGRVEIVELEGFTTLPSVISLTKGGTILIGNAAKRNQAKYPHQTIVEIKRKMGTDELVSLGDQKFKPQELSAMILRRIKELAEVQLGEPVTGVVISCPAYFKDGPRAATKEAGELAGLKVIRIINEPTAAAYAYGVREGEDQGERLFLVYDLGGGTFDVTVIKMQSGSLEVIGTGGDPKLGGGNFDDLIVDWMLARLEAKYPGYGASLNDAKRAAVRMRLKIEAEQGKKILCTTQGESPSYIFNIANVDTFQGKPVVFNETLTLTEFEGLIDGLLEKSFDSVTEALTVPREKHHYSDDQITAILLVGGSTRVPLVRAKLRRRFPNTEIWGEERGINPDEIVALGAGIVAADEDPDSDEIRKVTLLDVTGHTLSVAVFNTQLQREILAPIIHKETTIPHESSHQFQSMGQGQGQCKVKVFQGEGMEIDLSRVTLLGEFLIDIVPRMESTDLRIGLKLDADGILIAHATDESTGQRVECRINHKDRLQRTPEELKRSQAALAAKMTTPIAVAQDPLETERQATPAAAWSSRPAPDSSQANGAAQGNGAAHASGTAAAGAPAAASAGPPAPGPGAAADPTSNMNPILRSLYQSAISNFLRVPPERQGPLMKVVSDVEKAGRANDQEKLDSYLPLLAQLLQGVA